MTDHFERALQERLLARSQVSPRDVEALRLFARTLPARRSIWRPAIQWGLSAAAVALAAALVVPPLLNLPGFGGGPTPEPTPVPTVPATPEPTVPATPVPTPAVTPQPTTGLGPIRLDVSSGSNVTVTIDDETGLVVGGVAEQANAGMSFAWGNSKIETVGTKAIRITWVGYPRDEEVRLQVTELESGEIGLQFFQDAPLPNTDGEGEDRVMILTFTEDIDPESISVRFTDPS